MIAAVLHLHQSAHFHRRRAAEFAADDHQRVFEQAAGFQIFQQRGDAAVGFLRELAVDQNVVVIVPGLAVAVIDLHHAHAAFDEAEGHQAAAPEIAVAIAGAGASRLFADVEYFRRFGLHAEGDLGPIGWLASSCGSGPVRRELQAVQLGEQVELAALLGGRDGLVADVLDQLLGLGFVVGNVGALVDGRQEGRTPELRTDDGQAGTQHDEAGQVLILGAEAVGEPGAHGRPAGQLVAGVHHEQRGLVIGPVGVHGADDAAVVDAMRRGAGRSR